MAVPRLQVLGGFQLFAGGEARAAPIAMKAQALLARPLWGEPRSSGRAITINSKHDQAHDCPNFDYLVEGLGRAGRPESWSSLKLR